jgi:hypothetical protein
MRGVLSMKKRIESDILTAFQHEARGWQARAGNDLSAPPLSEKKLLSSYASNGIIPPVKLVPKQSCLIS